MKKYRLITACLLILLTLLLLNIFNRNRNSTIETFTADAATKEEITDELVIALFIEDITNVVTNFCSEYYSGAKLQTITGTHIQARKLRAVSVFVSYPPFFNSFFSQTNTSFSQNRQYPTPFYLSALYYHGNP